MFLFSRIFKSIKVKKKERKITFNTITTQLPKQIDEIERWENREREEKKIEKSLKTTTKLQLNNNNNNNKNVTQK